MASTRAPFTQRLAAFSTTHPYRVIALWLVVCVLMGWLAATALPGNLTATFTLGGNYQSVQAKQVLRDAGLPPVTESRESVLVDGGDRISVDSEAFKTRERAIAEALRHQLTVMLREHQGGAVTVPPITLEQLKAGKLPSPSVVDRQHILHLIDEEKEARRAEFTRRGEDLSARAAALQEQQETLQFTQQSTQTQARQGRITPAQLEATMGQLIAQGEALTAQGAQLQRDQATLEADIAAAKTEEETAQAKADELLNALVGKDRQSSLILVNAGIPFADMAFAAWQEAVEAQSDELVTATSLGQTSIQHAFSHIVEEDLTKAERSGVPITLMVLIVVFGAVVAALNSLLLAVVAITGALGLAAVVGQFMTLQLFISNMISMLGLAVGIDYCLFVTERYREERRAGKEVREAIITAGATSGMAMTFSGATVILSLLGIMFVPLNVYQSMSAGAVLVVSVAVLAVLTLLPAILAVLGDKINWPIRSKPHRYREVSDEGWLYGGFFGRVTKLSVQRPWLVMLSSVALLITLALPALGLKTGFVGADSLPRGPVHDAVHRLYDQWAQGQLFPVEIVASAPDAVATLEGIATALESDPLVEATAPIESSDTEPVSRLDVYLTSSPSAPATYDWIRTLRTTYPHVLVGGQSAGEVDMQLMLAPTTPLAIIFVLALSFMLLMVAFRSIVVPIKAMVYNVLSVGATYGVMTLVFSHGVGIDLLGYTPTPTIEAWLPILLFCVLFGLSMDYHVFILSRMREHYDATGNNSESVAVGIRSTSRIITGAALIMVVVFLTFSFGSATQIQQLGFGLAVAVFLDATIIRSLLVPSLMVLMNDLNWWLPRWLHWLPRINIEGTPTP